MSRPNPTPDIVLDPSEPVLAESRSLYPESETPLADVDPLLPTLQLFQAVTSGRYMREKAAALYALAVAGKGVWSFSELDNVLWWMTPEFKRYIVGQLRGSILLYDELSRIYSLNPEARIVCTVLTALGGKDKLDARMLIGHLLKIQELSEVGRPSEHRWDVLRTAVAWLQSRHFELESATRKGLVEEAIRKAKDVDGVLGQIREFLTAQDATLREASAEIPDDVRELLREGHRTTAEILHLVRFVYRTLATEAQEFLTGARNFTADDVRRFAASASRDDLIALMRVDLEGIPWNAPETAARVLDDAVEHQRQGRVMAPVLPPVEQPQLRTARLESDGLVTRMMASIVGALEESHAVPVDDLILGAGWDESAERGRLLAEAHARLLEEEKEGGLPAPDLDVSNEMVEPSAGGVEAMTRANLKKRGDER